jgi:hypothetical protein
LTLRRSPRKTQLLRTETSEAQLDGNDDANGDDTDLAGLDPTTVNKSIRRRSSRLENAISGTASPVPPRSIAAVNPLIRRQSRRQTPLPRIKMSETHLDDDNADVDIVLYPAHPANIV